MDIKHFVLLDWVERDMLLFTAISTHDNGADLFNKSLGKQLFWHHTDTIIGKKISAYAQGITSFLSLPHDQALFRSCDRGGCHVSLNSHSIVYIHNWVTLLLCLL